MSCNVGKLVRSARADVARSNVLGWELNAPSAQCKRGSVRMPNVW
jgi:hypothetical protein